MNPNQNTDRPRIVIVGAGFAGIEIVQQLEGEPVELLLIDRHNYHTFQPLLYQVVTAGLEPEAIAWSVRDIFQGQDNFRFRMDKIVDVNLDKKLVISDDGDPIQYDQLVLAAGASTDYFGVPGAKEHAYPVKNLMNAVNLKSHIIRLFEHAEENPDFIDEGYLNFVIAGGGPTGVETAGALVELFDEVLRKDFGEIDVSKARVILVEMKPNLLETYDEKLQNYTYDTLRNRDVEIRLGESVVEVHDDHVKLESGDSIPTQTLIWAAGVRANPLANRLGVRQTENNRVIVDDDLRVPNHDDVFVVGDMAGARNESGELYPQLAPVAIQQATHVSDQIMAIKDNRETEPFHYDNPGKMATVGINAAVAELPGGFKISGFTAWIMWVFIHIYKLIGFRNRFLVFFEWVHNYFTYDRTARLILDVIPESDDLPPLRENIQDSKQANDDLNDETFNTGLKE